MIEMINVTKDYGKGDACTQALRGVNLSIEKGSFTAIMGPSGSGKTSLLNIIGGMDRMTSGQYFFNSESVGEYSNTELESFRRKNVAFIFQNFALMNRYSVFENVEMPLIARGVRNRKEIVMRCLDEVKLHEIAGKTVNHISGGERQRTAIARALAIGAPLLLADEPTGALDSTTGTDILKIFEKIHKSGKTIIMITHDEKVAARAERTIRIENGIII